MSKEEIVKKLLELIQKVPCDAKYCNDCTACKMNELLLKLQE